MVLPSMTWVVLVMAQILLFAIDFHHLLHLSKLVHFVVLLWELRYYWMVTIEATGAQPILLA